MLTDKQTNDPHQILLLVLNNTLFKYCFPSKQSILMPRLPYVMELKLDCSHIPCKGFLTNCLVLSKEQMPQTDQNAALHKCALYH